MYGFCDALAGENAKVFLWDWERSLVYDDAQVGGYQDSAPGLSSAYMVLLQSSTMGCRLMDSKVTAGRVQHSMGLARFNLL